MSAGDRKLEIEIAMPARARNGRQRLDSVPRSPSVPAIPRITRLMALAIKFQDMIDRGEIRDYADLARLGYVTRARITQIMNLLLLAPDIQADILTCSPAASAVAERHLRRLTKISEWEQQRQRWRELGGACKAVSLA